jgi:microcystin-dependent protein
MSGTTSIGMILPYAGDIRQGFLPRGFLFCDGSAISRSQYSDLFDVIGVSFGVGDGVSTFKLPDFRGRFIRGVDNASGHDPDASRRVSMASGGNPGDNVGSIQTDEILSHTHFGNVSGVPQANATTMCAQAGGLDIGDIFALRMSYSGGAETRPKNAAAHFIIKYTEISPVSLNITKTDFSSQSFVPNTRIPLSWDSYDSIYDPYKMKMADKTALFLPTQGEYDISSSCLFDGSLSGIKNVTISVLINGRILQENTISGVSSLVCCSSSLNSGDFVEIRITQDGKLLAPLIFASISIKLARVY